MLKTEKCVICSAKAKYWHGYVLAKERMALGNYIHKKIIAGFCDKHTGRENELACYGDYDYLRMGKCIPLFTKVRGGEEVG